MIYLLIGGAQSVGKTETITRITQLLQSRNFRVIVGDFPPENGIDFLILLEGIDNSGRAIRILINSATDKPELIQRLRTFYDRNERIDFVISSIRDAFSIRDEFYLRMNVVEPQDIVIEIPLAKITRRMGNFDISLNWYRNTIDNLITHTLSNPPFDII